MHSKSVRVPPREAVWPEGTVFTVGHSTMPIERFLGLLQTFGVDCVADIRTIPRSRHNPQFNDVSLANRLTEAHLEYVPMKELGGLRHAAKESINTGWRNESFRGYADYMQTGAFQTALEVLIGLSRRRRVALMCAEAVPWRCHRSLVADALRVRGIEAIEILSESAYRVHQLTPFAHVEGLRLTYPGSEHESSS